MKARKSHLATALAVSSCFFLTSPFLDAALLAGVDFEGTGPTDFNRNPDDYIAADGVTVSSGTVGPDQWDGWTLRLLNGNPGANGNLRNDGGANSAGATSPNFPARLEGNRTGSWSITIDPGTTINLESIVFDVRAATNGSGRDGFFRTSLQAPGDFLWQNTNLPGRVAGWEHVDLDLTGNPVFQNLSGQTIDFIWETNGSGAIDLDTIQVFGAPAVTAIPEPSSAILVGLGSLGLLMRRSRK